MPKRNRHTPERMVRVLQDVEASRAAGRHIVQACQDIRISEKIYYRSQATLRRHEGH